MLMPHIAYANMFPEAICDAALRDNPQSWAERSTRFAERGKPLQSGFCAIVSIVARGYWQQINGQWRRNGL